MMPAGARTIHQVHARPAYHINGMPRPKLTEEPRVSTQIRLPQSLHERLRLAAQDRDVSVNLIATRALSEFLDRLVPSDVVLSVVRSDLAQEAS